MLQIRRGIGIIQGYLATFLHKNIFVTHHQNCLVKTVLMRGHNICLRNKKNYLLIILNTPSYLEHWQHRGSLSDIWGYNPVAVELVIKYFSFTYFSFMVMEHWSLIHALNMF